jgi:hypothetical protein
VPCGKLRLDKPAARNFTGFKELFVRSRTLEPSDPYRKLAASAYFLRVSAKKVIVLFPASAASSGRYPALLLGFSKPWPASGYILISTLLPSCFKVAANFFTDSGGMP